MVFDSETQKHKFRDAVSKSPLRLVQHGACEADVQHAEHETS